MINVKYSDIMRIIGLGGNPSGKVRFYRWKNAPYIGDLIKLAYVGLITLKGNQTDYEKRIISEIAEEMEPKINETLDKS